MSTTTKTNDASPLILTGSGYGLEIAPEYETKKAAILSTAAALVCVTDALSDNEVAESLKVLGAMRIEVEKCRTAVKAPALYFGKAVDLRASEFVSEIKSEEERLKRLREAYGIKVAEARNKIIAEMEAKRLAELAEKAAQDKALREAEDARRAAEEAEFSATSAAEDAVAAKLAEAAMALAAKQAEAAMALAAKQAEAMAAVTLVPEVPKGVKMVPEYEIESLDALYRHDASLVELAPKRSQILAAITAGRVGDNLPVIPGIKTFLKAQVR